jgi:hypothetical protein
MYEFTYEERVYLWQGVLYNQEDTKKGLDNPYLEEDVRKGLEKKLAVLNNLEDVLIFNGGKHEN